MFHNRQLNVELALENTSIHEQNYNDTDQYQMLGVVDVDPAILVSLWLHIS